MHPKLKSLMQTPSHRKSCKPQILPLCIKFYFKTILASFPAWPKERIITTEAAWPHLPPSMARGLCPLDQEQERRSPSYRQDA